MEFDVMTRATTWNQVADLARRTEAAGFSGMLFTDFQLPIIFDHSADLLIGENLCRKNHL